MEHTFEHFPQVSKHNSVIVSYPGSQTNITIYNPGKKKLREENIFIFIFSAIEILLTFTNRESIKT